MKRKLMYGEWEIRHILDTKDLGWTGYRSDLVFPFPDSRPMSDSLDLLTKKIDAIEAKFEALEASAHAVTEREPMSRNSTNWDNSWHRNPLAGPRKWYVSNTLPIGGIGPNDGNRGDCYEQPFATLQWAIGASTPERGDMIVMCSKGLWQVEVSPYTAALVLKFGGVE